MTALTRRPAVCLIVALALVVSAAARLDARAQSARDRYEQAVVLDRDARAASDRDGEAADGPVRSARRALTLYESVVRRFPTSGYCDNALLRSGDLARWLFTRSGRAADRTQAAKYYAWLVREYPASGLRVQARAAARALDSAEPEPVRRTTAAKAVQPAKIVAVPSPSRVPGSAAASAPIAASTPAPALTSSVAPAAAPILRGIDRAVVNGVVRVTLLLDRETTFAHEVIEGPRRAFVDLFGATPAADLKDAAIRYDAEAVRQVRVGRRPNATRVVLDLDGVPAVSVFTLYNPFRVVIDAERPAAAALPMTAAAFVPAPTPALLAVPTPAASLPPPAPAPIALPAVLRDDVLAAPRDENEMVSAAVVAVAIPDTAPYEPALAVPIVTSLPPAAPRGHAPSPVRTAPSIGSAPRAVTPAGAPLVLPLPASAPSLAAAVEAEAAVEEDPRASAPALPAANGDGTFSLARQLGLGVSRIVIDPGHGGHDPGTLTGGTTEARLVLDVALRLEKLLAKEAGLEVVLTRRTDVFIPLEERPALANREGADLFLSIHANASRDSAARGVETYFLSFASNPEAESVAARENATSASDMHRLPSIVRAIALNNKLDESRDLAAMVQQSLSARLAKTNPGMRSRGVKKAPFVVLIGAGMPSVLAEIGFITNRQDATLMKTPAYRQKIAESLHAAVLQYRRALKRQTSVATR